MKKTKHKKAAPARRRRRIMHSKPVHRRRRRRLSEDGLSELFNPETAKAAAKVIGAGAIGGLLAGGVNKVLSRQSNITRYGIEIGASFLTYALLGYTNTAAGMAGAFAALEGAPVYNKFLNEDGDFYANPDSLNEMPMLMNENGEMITLQEDGAGNMVYLNESTGETTLAEDVYLEESTYLQEDGIYPSYAVEYQ